MPCLKHFKCNKLVYVVGVENMLKIGTNAEVVEVLSDAKILHSGFFILQGK